MYIPTVADLAITGPFSVVDVDTAETLHTFTAAPDEPGDMPPESATWPILSITAEAGALVITTRAPKPNPAEEARRRREEFIRKQTATYTPGARRLW